MPEGDRLESWKEIAAYLGREVRTIQGWEKNEGLPIHRHQHARQGSIYAFRSELDDWRRKRAALPEVPEQRAGSGRRWLLAGSAGLVVLAGLAGLYLWKGRVAASSAPTSVVVLPFVDMSPTKDQEYFSDGLTEEIIDALSRVRNLHVVARTSAFAYKGKANDIRKIAEQLDVDSVLEGSVRKSGDQLRITAQLNRAADGFHLWSQTYDRPLRDVFAVQREISQAIANQLRAGEVSRREPTTDLEAYRLYQEGRYFFNQFSPASFPKAIERYQQAIARDPKFALAYAGLADAYSYTAELGITAPTQVMPKAKDAATRAVALDASSGEAHTALGLIKLDYEWNRPGAELEFRRASELNPSSSWAHHWLGHLAEAQGRLDDALVEMRAAITLDPLSMPLYWDLGWDLTMAHKYAEASSLLDKALDMFPGNSMFMMSRILLAYRMGDRVTGQRVLASLQSGSSQEDPVVLGMRGYASAEEGRKEDAKEALRGLERLRKTAYVDPFYAVQLCFALGDRACASLWLKRAHEDRSAIFVYVPLYYKDGLRLVPEAQALLADIR